MKNYISLLLFAAITIFSACQNTEVKTLSVDEFEKQIKADSSAQILDVRTAEEFNEMQLTGAINADWNSDHFAKDIQSLDPNKSTFVYCLGGKRSAAAAQKLLELGFKDVRNLEGGMRAWLQAGKSSDIKNPAATSEIKMSDFQKLIAAKPLVLADFNAPWCGPCKQQGPILDEIAAEKMDTIEIIKLNTDVHQEVSSALKIDGIPTLILYKNGKQVWRNEGLIAKSELNKIIAANQ